MSNFKRLYIFTGKGGVGKTTLSLSFCKFLEENNRKYFYAYIKKNKIQNDKALNESKFLLDEIEVKTFGLDLKSCSQGYIAKKLGSKTVASWVTKTPFYQSLISMIPGFSYVIYLGQLLELLVEDPELTIVLDSPSSGHAQTMLESTKNFNEIFQSGIVYEDTKKMLDLITKKDFTKVNIISLPTLLALHEAEELQDSLHQMHGFEMAITANNYLGKFESEELPLFLKDKIQNEKASLTGISCQSIPIPYSLGETSKDIVKDLVPSMGNLV